MSMLGVVFSFSLSSLSFRSPLKHTHALTTTIQKRSLHMQSATKALWYRCSNLFFVCLLFRAQQFTILVERLLISKLVTSKSLILWLFKNLSHQFPKYVVYFVVFPLCCWFGFLVDITKIRTLTQRIFFRSYVWDLFAIAIQKVIAKTNTLKEELHSALTALAQGTQPQYTTQTAIISLISPIC